MENPQISFDVFVCQIEQEFGKTLTCPAMQVVEDFWNNWQPITELIAKGQVAVRVNKLVPAYKFPQFKRRTGWDVGAIWSLITGLAVVLSALLVGLILIVGSFGLRFYARRLRSKDAKAFSEEIIAGIRLTPFDGGYVRLCANYIAGIVELLTAQASARWPQHPSNIIAEHRTFIDTTQKANNVVIMEKILALCIKFIGAKTKTDLVEQCEAMGMQGRHYEDVLGMDKTAPDFDPGYRFCFVTDDGIDATMEILQRNKHALQARVQINYPPATSEALISKHYSKVKAVADEHYGDANSVSAGDTEILNWADHATLLCTHRVLLMVAKA